MSGAEDPEPPRKKESIFRARAWLRFMPRRAVLHRYPVVGRFASLARSRAYLWSFRTPQLRPAFYLGAILAFWPVMGIQLPLALALCVLLRANFMVAAALQVITNPLTAAPIYYGTYRLGKAVLDWLGRQGASAMIPQEALDAADTGALPPAAHDLVWAASASSAFGALIIGGTLAGLVLGAILDAAYCSIGAARSRARSKDPT